MLYNIMFLNDKLLLTGAEAPLILYVCGYSWSAVRMCLMQGPQRYFTELWNWAEIIMLLLFGLTFALWVAAAIEDANAADDLGNYLSPTFQQLWKVI